MVRLLESESPNDLGVTFDDIFKEYGVEKQFQEEFRTAVVKGLLIGEFSEEFRDYICQNRNAYDALLKACRIHIAILSEKIRSGGA